MSHLRCGPPSHHLQLPVLELSPAELAAAHLRPTTRGQRGQQGGWKGTTTRLPEGECAGVEVGPRAKSYLMVGTREHLLEAEALLRQRRQRLHQRKEAASPYYAEIH